MAIKRMRLTIAAAGLVFTFCGLTGCQTQLAGMTLPSGYYLHHRPQYFPSEPDPFPLPRELATMQAQNAAAAEANAIGAGRLPPPVTAPVAPPAGMGGAGPGAPAVR